MFKRISIRGMKPAEADAQHIEYIGRKCGWWKGSPLGNPFKEAEGITREIAIEQFRHWLFDRINEADPDVLDELYRLSNFEQHDSELTIGCWCAPDQACHGDVIVAAIAWMRANPLTIVGRKTERAQFEQEALRRFHSGSQSRELTFQAQLGKSTFGLVVNNNTVTEAAPIASWMVGKPIEQALAWIVSKGGTAALIEPSGVKPTPQPVVDIERASRRQEAKLQVLSKENPPAPTGRYVYTYGQPGRFVPFAADNNRAA